MSERLLTILHISDLHIGQIDPITGHAKVSKASASLYANFSWFDGVLGHHARGLQELEKFYLDLVDKGEDPLVVTTGDLTSVGHSGDFQAANDFLGNVVDLNPPQGNCVGLRCAYWKDFSIPGNHDQWSGRPLIFGGPTSAFYSHFPTNSLPSVTSPIILSNGRELQFIRINTDADVHPWRLQRMRAVGSFQSQLAGIAPRLGRRSEKQIRVLLMHHSYHKRGAILSIDPGSRAALDNFIVDHGIKFILTGHTHKSLIQLFVPNIPGAHEVLECRSGSTTQSDQVPYSWRNFIGQFPNRKWPENKLLVHRLYEENNTTKWYTETFIRMKSQGFVSVGPVGQYDIVI